MIVLMIWAPQIVVGLLVVEICATEINFSELKILYLFAWLPYK